MTKNRKVKILKKKYDEKKFANEVTAGDTTHCLRASRKTLLGSSGVAWHTPVRTCVRLKTEIQKLEKPKKLKNVIKIFVNWGLGVKL